MRQKTFKLPKTKKIGIVTVILTLFFLTTGVGFSSWLSSHYEIESNPSFSQIALRGDLK